MRRLRPHEVRLIRRKLKMTQTAFAEALGLDNEKGNARRTISDWEAGRRKITGPVSLAIQFLEQQGAADES